MNALNQAESQLGGALGRLIVSMPVGLPSALLINTLDMPILICLLILSYHLVMTQF